MARKRTQQIVTQAVPVCMDTLGDLDNGTFRRLVDKEIMAVLNDLQDRGEEDGKPRYVMMKVEFIKVDRRTIITPVVDHKLPPRVAHSTSAIEKPNADGEIEFLFQPWNAENAEQPTFQADESEAKPLPPKG